MPVPSRWKRSGAALAATAAALPLALGVAAPDAAATPARSATTYVDPSYLQDALGLPAADANPVLEPVTYDRFQWLLKQPGQLAFLIGDPADANFAARAQDVEAAAKAAGAATVYWFDPNLSGSAQVGSTAEPALDIRTPAAIGSLTSASQTVYRNTWTNLVAQYLGNGWKATIAADPEGKLGPGAEGGKITTAADDTVVNDYGSTAGFSTEVGNPNGGALYGYTGGVDATATDDYFFVYDKDHTVTPPASTPQPAKIVSWVDLSTEANSTSARADVTTAIGTVGASNLDAYGQGAFWKSEVDAKFAGSQPEPAFNPTANASGPNGDDAVLTDGDVADWRIRQITYPQLVHLLTTDTAQNAIILFGGTWCPNTRAVLRSVNQYAIDNDVKVVYNFDTVLDGGWIGGSTTSATNPLQTRNYAGVGGSGDPTSSNPSFLYGDLVSSYLANIATEYDPTLGTGFASYYPGGNTAKALKNVRKLQVPFLIGYQRGISGANGSGTGGIARQWIQQHTDVNGLPYFTEYMSEPYWTHPQPFGLGLNVPHDAAAWTTINADLSKFTWKSDPTAASLTSHYDTGTDADDAHFLGAVDKATVTYNAGQSTVTAASAVNGSVDVSPAALAAAQTALGANAPATRSAAQAALLAAEQAGNDQPLIDHLSTVFGAFAVAQQRKNNVLIAFTETQFGLEAVAKLSTFFGGLPGGVVSTQTVTAPAVRYGTAPKISVAIANDYGRVPTGDVHLTVKKGSTTVVSVSKAVAQNAASFTLPKLGAGSYAFTLGYAGDDQIVAFTRTGTLTVTKAKVNKVSGAVVKAPTTKASGSYRVTVTTASGLAKATGTVTVKIHRSSTTRTLSGRLAKGAVTVTVPKSAKGTWTVSLSYRGDANYSAATATGASIKVTK